MKKPFLMVLVLFATVSLSLSAQDNRLEVIGSTSASFETPSGGSLDYTVGEVIVGTSEIGDRLLTQGFHQPYLIDCNLLSADAKVECVDENHYTVELTLDGGNTGALGYSVIANNPKGFSGTSTNGIVTDGPFELGELLTYTVSMNSTPECEEYISVLQAEPCSDAIVISDFEGTVVQSGNLLSWNVQGQSDLEATYVISRFVDGIGYIEVAQVSSQSSFVDEYTEEGLTNYRLEIKDSEAKSKSVTLMRIVEEASIAYQVTTYPNPVIDKVNVELKDYQFENAFVSMFSIGGKQIHAAEYNVINGKFSVDCSALRISTYLISIADQDGKLITTKKIQKIN